MKKIKGKVIVSLLLAIILGVLVYSYLLQDIWRQSGFASSKLNLILNMKDKKTSLGEDEIEKNCGAKVICSIPDFGAEFRKKCNEGILPVKMRGKIKKIFLEAAEKILNY